MKKREDYGRNTMAWQRLRARVRAASTHCGICRQPLDHGLPYPHPRSTQVDHIVPLSQGGRLLDLGNVRAAHFGCNASRGASEMAPETPWTQYGYHDTQGRWCPWSRDWDGRGRHPDYPGPTPEG